MSDLKHRSPEELRRIIANSEQYRGKLETSWSNLEAQAEGLKRTASALRTKYHNVGQRVAWARFYLAKKELGEMP